MAIAADYGSAHRQVPHLPHAKTNKQTAAPPDDHGHVDNQRERGSDLAAAVGHSPKIVNYLLFTHNVRLFVLCPPAMQRRPRVHADTSFGLICTGYIVGPVG